LECDAAGCTAHYAAPAHAAEPATWHRCEGDAVVPQSCLKQGKNRVVRGQQGSPPLRHEALMTTRLNWEDEQIPW